MTREILSSALDMIDERYIASVTNKKMHPIGQKSLYTYKIVKPSAWRNLLDVAAVLILVVGVTVGFILMRQSIGPGTTPGDSLTDTDTEETSAHDTTETEEIVEYTTYVDGDKVYALYEDHAELIKADSVFGKPVPKMIGDLKVTTVADSVTFADYDTYGALIGYRHTAVYNYAIENGLDFIEIHDGEAPRNHIANPSELVPVLRVDAEGIENSVKGDRGIGSKDTWYGDFNIREAMSDYMLSTDEDELREAEAYILDAVIDHMKRTRFFINSLTGGLPSYYSENDPSKDYFANKYRVAVLDADGNIARVHDLARCANIETYDVFSSFVGKTFCDEMAEVIYSYAVGADNMIYAWQGGEPAVTYSLDGAVYDIDINLHRIELTAKVGDKTYEFVLQNSRDGKLYDGYWHWESFDGFVTRNTIHEIKATVTIRGVIYELCEDEYIATGVSDTSLTQAVIPPSYDKIPITGIADGAFDSVADPLNFRIFGYEDTYAHDYAVEHGHIFIEWYDGKFPNHYYPEGVKLNEWTKSEPRSVYIAVDDNAEIDKLVSDYLSGKDVYDELIARAVYRFRCLDDLYQSSELRQYYYTSKEYNVGDYDRYQIYIPVYLRNGYFQANAYTWERYGEIEYYDDYVKNEELLLGELFDDSMINVEGWFFFPDQGIGTSPLCNTSCNMTVEEGKITLTCTYQDFYGGEPWGELETGTAVLVRGENGWYFDTSYYCYSGVSSYLEHLFEDYLDEIKGK